MDTRTLDLLRCPFCGTRPALLDNAALSRGETTVESGVLACECCAFPIVAGIPVMVADDTTRTAMHQLEAGAADAALFTLLGLDGDEARAARFRALLDGAAPATYAAAVAILSPDAEGLYFIYRFSDPTFLMAAAVVRAVGLDPSVRAGRVLDLCGGSGHLSRIAGELAPAGGTVLADVFFWKLWLARRFTAPGVQAVCCDANQPLPFARAAFALAVCSDAFPYIWQKRLLAEEMMRLAGPDGIVVLPHLHSALGYNFSAGMPLTPAAYRDLFAPLGGRLFKDSSLLASVLRHEGVNLGDDAAPDALGDEPSVTLVASRRAGIFRAHPAETLPAAAAGLLTVNPLYRIERRDGTSVLTLTFPSPAYEEEFGECKQYLPPQVIVAADLTVPFDAAALGADYPELRRRHVILDAPKNYI